MRTPRPGRKLGALIPLLYVVACKGDDSGADDSAPPLTITELGCHETDPVISDLLLYNSGLQKRDGKKVPTITFSMDLSDDDGELSAYRIEASYDDKVDGKVVPDAFNTFVKTVENTGDDCMVTEQIAAEYTLAVTGEYLEVDTEYEWGLSVYDASDGQSELAITSGYTPKVDGSDGGP